MSKVFCLGWSYGGSWMFETCMILNNRSLLSYEEGSVYSYWQLYNALMPAMSNVEKPFLCAL